MTDRAAALRSVADHLQTYDGAELDRGTRTVASMVARTAAEAMRGAALQAERAKGISDSTNAPIRDEWPPAELRE